MKSTTLWEDWNQEFAKLYYFSTIPVLFPVVFGNVAVGVLLLSVYILPETKRIFILMAFLFASKVLGHSKVYYC